MKHGLKRTACGGASRAPWVVPVLLAVLAGAWPAAAEDAPIPAWSDAAGAAEHPGFRFLGEYVRGDEALQVAPAEGRFFVSRFRGGLPGQAGASGVAAEHRWVEAADIAETLAGFERVDRSAGLGFTPPPEGGLVLFDGTGVEHFRPSAKVDGTLLKPGAVTRRTFRDFTLHFEVQMPYKPTLPVGHPHRGNSGVFMLGAYEIQLMDSFALPLDEGEWKRQGLIKAPVHACGAVYGLRAPDVNMSLPPLAWQAFDVRFTAARFKDGVKVADARVTVDHNGVRVHTDYALPSGTGGGPRGPRPEVEEGPLMFQNHHNPNRFRNIWVLEHSEP